MTTENINSIYLIISKITVLHIVVEGNGIYWNNDTRLWDEAIETWDEILGD